MAYGAYQLTKPRETLLSSLVQSQIGAEVDPGIKRKKLMDELREMMIKEQKTASKRSRKWEPVTTALDVAAGFVDPATAAIMGAISGGFSGYDQMRAYQGMKGAGKGFEKYGFLRPQVANISKQIRGQKKDFGDVLVSAGTQALKNFVGAKAGQAIKGSTGGANPEQMTKAEHAKTIGKPLSGQASWLKNLNWKGLTSEQIVENIAGLTTQFQGPVESLGMYGKPKEEELDLSRLY
jgi:hypothetical protein